MMKLHSILLLLFSGTVYAESGSSGRVMYEVLDRLEQLQSEVQQLRGQVEQQNYTIEQLKKRQSTMYSDVDQRLQVMEGGGAPAAANQEMGGLQDAAAGNNRDQEVLKDPAVQPQSTAAGVAKSNEKQVYLEGYDQLRNGHYSQAIVLFNQVVVDYPDGEYADNAQYWLGETYKVNRNYTASRDAFQKLLSNYPDSPKVPDAMLKLGYLELEQNNIKKGRQYLVDVSMRYPGTTAANLANERLKLLDKK